MSDESPEIEIDKLEALANPQLLIRAAKELEDRGAKRIYKFERSKIVDGQQVRFIVLRGAA